MGWARPAGTGGWIFRAVWDRLYPDRWTPLRVGLQVYDCELRILGMGFIECVNSTPRAHPRQNRQNTVRHIFAEVTLLSREYCCFIASIYRYRTENGPKSAVIPQRMHWGQLLSHTPHRRCAITAIGSAIAAVGPVMDSTDWPLWWIWVVITSHWQKLIWRATGSLFNDFEPPNVRQWAQHFEVFKHWDE